MLLQVKKGYEAQRPEWSVLSQEGSTELRDDRPLHAIQPCGEETSRQMGGLPQAGGNKHLRNRPGTTRSLTERFAPTVSRSEELRRKIGTYLLTRHTQTDIARLKIALEELRYLTLPPIPIKPFRDALQEEYGRDHIQHHERKTHREVERGNPAQGRAIP